MCGLRKSVRRVDKGVTLKPPFKEIESSTENWTLELPIITTLKGKQIKIKRKRKRKG